jgi:hypothetical protein
MNLGNWYTKNDSGIVYEYIGDSYAQFAGNIPIVILRDTKGNEIQPARMDFDEKFTSLTAPPKL